MVLKVKIKNFFAGVTLVEIIVVIFIISVFSLVLISDFPKTQRQFALSRSAYKLAQDFRRAQDLGLSGVQMADSRGQPILVRGYGVYFDLAYSIKQYAIYADVDGDQKYSGGPYSYCDQAVDPVSDCAIDVVDVSKENPFLHIKQFNNIVSNYTSANFSPPGPDTKIENLYSGSYSLGIVLGLSSDSLAERTVWLNTSGLINVQ